MADSVEWEVELPDKQQYSSFSRKPRARIILSSAEGEESFIVPLAVAKRMNAEKELLEVGSRAELLYRIREASEACAWDKFLRLLNMRDYSEQEIREKISQDGYSSAVADAVVERALNAKLLDDMRFADIFIRSKVLSGWGSLRIVRELKQRGVDAKDVPGWPDEYLGEDEYDRAMQLALTRKESQRLSYEKMARYLSSRGFSASVSSRVASAVVQRTKDELSQVE